MLVYDFEIIYKIDPYKVFENIGTTEYKLEIPASLRVHPVFHVSCLKKVIGDKIPFQTIFPELDKEGKIILDPKAIIDTIIHQLRNTSISNYISNYLLKTPHGKMSILYRSIQNYSNGEYNTCLNGRGMLSPNSWHITP
jgi:hypothetical protein